MLVLLNEKATATLIKVGRGAKSIYAGLLRSCRAIYRSLPEGYLDHFLQRTGYCSSFCLREVPRCMVHAGSWQPYVLAPLGTNSHTSKGLSSIF